MGLLPSHKLIITGGYIWIGKGYYGFTCCIENPNAMAFYLSDLLLFPAIIQGIFISGFLFLKKTENQIVNRSLAMLMLCSAFMLIGRMVYDRFPEGWMTQIAFIPDINILLFGPLSYIFVFKLLTNEKQKLVSLHFIPAFLYSLMLVYFFTVGSGVFDQLIANRKIWEIIFFVETSGIVSNMIYLGLSFKLILSYRSEEKKFISYEHPVLGFIKVYFIGILLGLSLWTASFISGYFFNYFNSIINYTTLWYSIPLTSYIIGYYMIIKPPIFSWKISSGRLKNMRLETSETDMLKNKLNLAIAKHRLFINEDVTLKELADLIETSPHNLSWLLNEVYHQNFYEFINSLRIQEFVSKVQNSEHERKTILGLAMEVGFKSKSTFNKAFRSIYNLTPSEFIQQKDQKVPESVRFSA